MTAELLYWKDSRERTVEEPGSIVDKIVLNVNTERHREVSNKIQTPPDFQLSRGTALVCLLLLCLLHFDEKRFHFGRADILA